MAVREFDGTDDDIVVDIGGLSAMTHGTFAVLFKRASTGGDFRTLICLHTSGSVPHLEIFLDQVGNELSWYDDSVGGLVSEGPLVTATDRWFLAVVRKASGTVEPRFSLYDFTADSWFHGDGDGAYASGSSVGSGGTARFSFSGGEFWHGRIAARAVWSNSLPWSADASGDSAIEAAGLETWAKNWIDNSPDAMWRFNQDATTTAVVDDTENGADQTSITGTTVVTGDDPPGFDFSLGGDQELDVPFHQQITSFFPLTVANQSAQELNVPHHGSEVQIFSPSVANQTSQELNVPHLASSAQLFAPSITTGDHELDVPHLVNVNSFFLPVAENQLAQNLSVGFITSTAQLFVITVENQLDENLSLPFFQNVALLFTPLVFNEGEELFEPTLVGNGTLADRIMEGLIDQGFLTGSIVDREYARLLAKLSLTAPQPKSLDDLYSMAGEDNRILGIGVDVLTPA